MLSEDQTKTMQSMARQSQSNLDELKPLSGKDFEVDFLNMMIEHHESSIGMAKLAPDRANHQEVKDTAQKMVSAQGSEIKKMTGWLQEWYDMAPKQGSMRKMPGMSMSEMTAMLQSLKGDDFDKQFLTMMTMHHMSAIKMAQLVPDRATHSELKTLAQNIISSQSAEIKQFEGWLKSWYNMEIKDGSA